MTTDGHPTKASLRELEPHFGPDAAGRDRAVRHSTLRLQPTVLPPPPAGDGRAILHGASPDDDLDLGLEADDFARRRQLLLAAAGVAIAIAGTVAFLAFGPSSTEKAPVATRPPVEASRPVVVTPPPTIAPAPTPAPASPPATPSAPPSAVAPSIIAPAPQAVTPLQDAGMGQITNELVPPSTDGLSAPRKVNSVRIVVDGDREVRN